MKTDTLTIIRQIDERLQQLQGSRQKHDCLNIPHIRKDWSNLRRRLTRRLELEKRLTKLSSELDDFAFTARSFFRGVTKNPPLLGLQRSRKSGRKHNAEFYTELSKAIRKLPKKVADLLESQTGKDMAHYRRLIKKWCVASRDAEQYGDEKFRADVVVARERLRLLGALGAKRTQKA
jgi:hypothetical protein